MENIREIDSFHFTIFFWPGLFKFFCPTAIHTYSNSTDIFFLRENRIILLICFFSLKIIPDQAADRREMAVGVMQRLEDLNTVLGQTNDHRHR